MSMPLVSVIIPTCNRPAFIERALRSVLAQTLQDFEVIVVDDGLEKRAEGVVASFADPRIHYLKNEKGAGAPASRNRGAHTARAQYLAFLDDDDRWYPEKLAVQVEALEKNPEACAAYTSIEMCDKEGKRVATREHGESGITNIFARTLYRPYIWTSALMVRKSAFDAVGGFDEAFPKNQEWDLELRLAKTAFFFGIDKILVSLTVMGEDEHLGGKRNLPNIIRGHEMLLEKHRDAYERDDQARGRVSFIVFSLYRDANNIEGMRRWSREAWRARPWNAVYLCHYLASLSGLRFYSILRKIAS